MERVDFTRDIHFYTRTTIDTLDYSGSDLNSGSKVVVAVAGNKKRELKTEISSDFNLPEFFTNPHVVMPGIIAVKAPKYSNGEVSKNEIDKFNSLAVDTYNGFPLIVLCDDSEFVALNLNNFLWVTFTRSNPSHDIYGINSFTENKHWGCKGSLIIDARIKPHHAPPLIKDPEIEKRVDTLGLKGKSLYGII